MSATATPPVDKYVGDGAAFITGLQALVRLPLEQRAADERAGLRTAVLISGYPGSPLGGLDLELERNAALLEARDIVHQPGVNEDLAATSILGSQRAHTVPGARYEGVVGIWYGKAPGLDRSGDAMRHGNYGGVAPAGGVLVVVGDDPTAKSSTVPAASEGTLAALLMPVLYPGDVQEVVELGLHGIAMSRCSGLWVGFKMAVNVADGWGSVVLAPGRVEPKMVGAELDGRAHRHEPTRVFLGQNVHDMEHSLVHARLNAALAYARANELNRVVHRTDHDVLGIVAVGKTYYDLRQALSDMGVDDDDLGRLGVRLLHIRMPYPLDGELLRDFAGGLDKLLVLEDKQPFVERFVKEELYNLARRPTVIGKQDEQGRPLARLDYELDPDAIAEIVGPRLVAGRPVPSVEARLRSLRSRPAIGPLPVARSAYFCSGCPHNSSLKAPEGSLVAAGIGCHGMVQLMRGEEDGVGNVIGMTQMGGEGAQWIGQAPFTDSRHVFQNLGDGTFHHSGSLAVRAAVAAKVNVTYKLLWNSHVSMTGGQAPTGGMSLPDAVRSLIAEGVRKVIVTSDDVSRWDGRLPAGVEAWSRERLLEAQEVLSREDGITVLVHDQECAAELRRRRKRGTAVEPTQRVFINERVCEGCGDCGVKSNCLSVQPVDTEFGRKTQIHQASCNKDYSCLKGDCPSFITVVPGKRGSAPGPAPLSRDDLPDPVVRRDEWPEFGMRLSGIGGTGVVTVAQVLATAAMLDGWHVRGMDQTGLAQKGGAVVSDLRLMPSAIETSGRLSAGRCDLYLAGDLLAAAAQPNLVAADPERTVAVLSTTRVPTGGMIADVTATYPPQTELVERILARCDADASFALDAQHAAERLFGTDVVANMLLLGVALQTGALPVSPEAVERAIEKNGAAVPLNVQAFRRGRQAVADPEAFAAAVAATEPVSTGDLRLTSAEERIAASVGAAPDSPLGGAVRIRVAELAAYQDLSYATRYAGWVERVRAAEAERTPGRTELAEAVAFSLHKLMAYKDEYEVARLHLDPRLHAEIEAEFGAGARFRYRLHPPILRAMGYDRKIELGRWFDPAFRVLRAMRRLRGTRLDLFGYARVRRVERELVREFEGLLEGLLRRLSPSNHAAAVELARLPDMVRGYEEIKLGNVARYRQRSEELTRRLAEA
ncbi:MAG: indolepyruvate ferredoxin oxidoreductase family protein [Solirubrobacterales bacterium]|nr:indolepyruvate ferredoxin oxidoreductase family protein [Solirubrobacterales bacterium]